MNSASNQARTWSGTVFKNRLQTTENIKSRQTRNIIRSDFFLCFLVHLKKHRKWFEIRDTGGKEKFLQKS